MTCEKICDYSQNEELLSTMDDPMQLLVSLSNDSSKLTNMCAQVLRGREDQEPFLTDVAYSLNATIREIRAITDGLRDEGRFMTAVAGEVRKALEKICGLSSLIRQTQDNRATCLVDVGESLNSFYHELGLKISRENKYS
jgi:hypothetical protein